ncbi:hypothetical protein SUGI_1032520 [Cryptomeria japonica]|nr:hypothetical protein SUGI_1032520 [Cryptomeria japonica]
MSLKKLNQLNSGHNRLTGEIPEALKDTINLYLVQKPRCNGRDVKSSNIFKLQILAYPDSRVLRRLGDEYMVSGYVGSYGYITQVPTLSLLQILKF